MWSACSGTPGWLGKWSMLLLALLGRRGCEIDVSLEVGVSGCAHEVLEWEHRGVGERRMKLVHLNCCETAWLITNSIYNTAKWLSTFCQTVLSEQKPFHYHEEREVYIVLNESGGLLLLIYVHNVNTHTYMYTYTYTYRFSVFAHNKLNSRPSEFFRLL